MYFVYLPIQFRVYLRSCHTSLFSMTRHAKIVINSSLSEYLMKKVLIFMFKYT